MSAWRTTKLLYGTTYTVVVVKNQQLQQTQTATLLREIAKRRQRLHTIQQLWRWYQGRVTKGRRPTLAGTQRKVAECLKARHMKDLFEVSVTTTEQNLPKLTYRFDRQAWKHLQRTLLGKNLIFTDRAEWSDAQIVRGYRAQHHVERAFRDLKNTQHLAIRPQYHWTDQKIQVHVLICVLSLMMQTLLYRSLANQGHTPSCHQILDELTAIKEIGVIFPPKKLRWNTTFGTIIIEETLYRRGTKTVREFSDRFGVSCRGVSMRLQRVVVDFGADISFARVNDKLREHYGFQISVSRIREVVLGHGQRIFDAQVLQDDWPQDQGVEQIIAQTDGSMVPVVETDPESVDRRKGKVLKWQEIRLCLAHRVDSLQVHYGGNFSGGVEKTGQWLYDCARRAGFGRRTKVHVVGDGAGWICRQVEERFGANGTFLVDFMHLSEYLSEAGKSFCADVKRWLKSQQARLKDNQAKQVLLELKPYLESSEVDEDNAPVRKAYRYLRNRQDQVDYRGARERKLPIGSGEIESGHRYVIQARLKLAGSWWSPDSIDRMLALRLCRANQDWDDYWESVTQRAA